jgi:hypothetical protein
MLLLMLIGYLPWLLFGGGLLYLGVRAVRALERRSTANTELTTLRERLDLLEETVSAQADAMRRVEDGQRFTERLLADRSGSALRPADERAAIEDARVNSREHG